MRMRIGPLKYLFEPHDDRAGAMLSVFSKNMDCVAFSDSPDRIIHLLESPADFQEINESGSRSLPDRFVQFLPETCQASEWKLLEDCAGNPSWLHEETEHTFWTLNPHPFGREGFFQIPWQIILHDIVRRGGGIMHCAMAAKEDRCVLLAASGGGGKTTTVSRLASPWIALADDSVLLWPAGRGAYRASPLPSLSALLQPDTRQSFIRHWHSGRTYEIAGLMFLLKSNREKLSRRQPVAVVQRVYEALCEHVEVPFKRWAFGREVFHIACNIAKTIPTWRLAISLEGNLVSLLEGSLHA